MKIRGIRPDDFVNYKKPSTFVIFPYCSMKCDIEANCKICQNSELMSMPIMEVPANTIVAHHMNNSITHAVVCGGMEPMDTFEDLLALLSALRSFTEDDFVIYTGYNKDEIADKISILQRYKNVFVKFGRFISGQKHHFDPILGVELASPNQYAERIS